MNGELEALVPPLVMEAFPGLEVPGADDFETIARQLGREPRGRVLVSRRCVHGRPAVIFTLPVEGGGGPTPPLLWLCCPHASAKTGTLESVGGAQRIAAWLEEDSGAAARFERDEEAFESVQVALARAAGEGLASRVEGRGVAGGSPGAIKCLHAHLAYRLSVCTDGPTLPPGDEVGPECSLSPPGERVGVRGPAIVGLWCQRQLAREGGTWCERPPAACVT